MQAVRKLLLTGLLLLVLLGVSESLSSLVLFHSLVRDQHVSATVHLGELVWFRVRAALTGVPRRKLSSEPSPLFVGHPTWGFTIAPGDYTIRIHDGFTGRDHAFRARVLPDGSRATRDEPVAGAPPRMYLFGDSWLWGWGNQDEHTVGWLLQGWLPRWDVRNFAQNGYGNVQALVQIRELAGMLRAEDVVVLGYADFYDVRNVAVPSRLREFRIARELQAEETKLTHPRASLVGGTVQIDAVDLAGDHSGADPDPGAMQEVTIGILAEVAQRVPGPLVLAYLEGPNLSPVVTRAAALGFHIADLRPRRGQHEWDDLLPFDPHPGPLAEWDFADKLYGSLLPLTEGR